MTTASRHSRTEEGSAAVEMVIVTPVLMLIAMAAIGLGQIEQADLAAQIAAGAAVRAATLARTPQQAVADATRMATVGGSSCPRPSVTIDTASFRPGGTVTVAVACHPSLAQLTGLGLPGTLSIKERVTDGIDPWRAAGQP